MGTKLIPAAPGQPSYKDACTSYWRSGWYDEHGKKIKEDVAGALTTSAASLKVFPRGYLTNKLISRYI